MRKIKGGCNMTAFESQTDLEKWYVEKAVELNASTLIDDEVREKLATVNEKGKNGVPSCACAIKFSLCPCKNAKEQIEKDGECHCELFKRLKV
jgi:ferredoxin-thioredoxin reductase catalytic subunit